MVVPPVPEGVTRDRDRRPLIGVTGYRIETGTEARTVNVAVKESYLQAVRLGGGIPVVLAPTEDRAEIAALLERVEGVLLTGGRDIDPRWYGQPVFNDTVRIEAYRDAFELPLARLAVERDVPVLGVCRGCQVLAVALGGSLWQDLPAQRPGGVLHSQSAPREAVTHEVRVDRDSLLGDVLTEFLPAPLLTNTFHHQAAQVVPDSLHVVAHAADGTIEALELPARRFVLGVQWHPEDLAVARAEHRRLFEALASAARCR